MAVMQRESLDLSGEWAACTDPYVQGITDRWYTKELTPEYKSVNLPGCLQEQGIGEPPNRDTEWVGSQFDRSFYEAPRYATWRESDNFKFPYWLQPELRYVGVAWFQREFSIPEEWSNCRVVLHLERPHWGTHVWVDGVYLGSRDSLSVPHEYEIEGLSAPGRHRIDIRVDNRILYEVGPNAHSVSDHTQGNWNGIVGEISLRATQPVYVAGVDVFPNPRRRTAILLVRIGNMTASEQEVKLTVRNGNSEDNAPIGGLRAGVHHEWQELGVGRSGTTYPLEVRFGNDQPLWDEFSPELVDLTVELENLETDTVLDRCPLRLGLRTVTADDKRIMVNDSQVFLRGTLECAVFPKTGYPPTDQNSWREIYRRAREYGFNHLRFHSWCPPEAAFDAADVEGFYLQVECPLWANQGASVGTDERLDQWLFRESERIVNRYGNHPSFIMFAAGNEPAGRIEEFLSQWVVYWKNHDGRRLYTTSAGWPAVDENDYQNVHAPRIHQWGDGVQSRINSRAPETVTDYRAICSNLSGPVVSHEIGQWCAFPDFSEIPQYTGYLKPRNFEIFREFLSRHGMLHQAEAFLQASGRLQVLCYREEIESALRTPNLAGFQLLGLTDFPGQGTALVGVLNALWRDKGYCSGGEFREFCGPSVLLARLPKRYYRVGETTQISVDLSHHGGRSLGEIEVEWRIVAENGEIMLHGELTKTNVTGRGLIHLGIISVPLEVPEIPARYELQVKIPDHDILNRWGIWCFPDRLEDPDHDVYITDRIDSETESILKSGGSVLLNLDADRVRGDVAIGFSSVFWNTAWTQGQAPHTLGILCDANHPGLADFPTDNHSDWQWWELVSGSAAMVLDDLPSVVQPIVQPIDTWFRSHRLALLMEIRAGGGRMVVSSMDLTTDLDERIVARQMRVSLLRYMMSTRFEPTEDLSIPEIQSLFVQDG